MSTTTPTAGDRLRADLDQALPRRGGNSTP
jgi:hypothetical protein